MNIKFLTQMIGNKFIATLVVALAILGFITPFAVQAQVTIGNLEKPVSGALLQLKERDSDPNGANSNRGLGMPRVAISDRASLNNVLSDEEMAANVNYKEDHTGLMIYSPDECVLDGNGLYVWNGNLWNKLGTSNVKGMKFDPELIKDATDAVNPNVLTFDLPSGYDNRLWSLPFNLKFLFDDGSVMQNGAAVVGGAAGPMLTGTPNFTLNTSPGVVAFNPNKTLDPYVPGWCIW